MFAFATYTISVTLNATIKKSFDVSEICSILPLVGLNVAKFILLKFHILYCNYNHAIEFNLKENELNNLQYIRNHAVHRTVCIQINADLKCMILQLSSQPGCTLQLTYTFI